MQGGAHPRTLLLSRRAFVAALATLLTAIIALPVLADQIGPNRTVTTFKWERLQCHYEAVYDPSGPGYFGCTLNLYEPPDGNCPAEGDVAGLFNPSACVGWPGSCGDLPCDISLDDSIRGCSEGETGCRAVEKTSELSPATVNGSISCSAPGSGGWCRGGAELSATGSEPLDGESIVSIEGTRNGETFACSGAACSVPLLEGANAFTFWARSSYGDTSYMGSADGKLDSVAPSLSGDVSGTGGDGGWFVSEATVSAAASDPAPGSGLKSLEVRIDGSGWSAYNGPIVLGDGEHSVDLRAADVAGNTAESSQAVRVDTLPPEVGLSSGGSFCPGCGQTLEIALSVADAGSGIAEWTLVADGVGVASGSGPESETLAWNGGGLGGGSHTLTLEARDAAGNAGSASQSFDLIVPTPRPDPPTDEPEERVPPPPTSTAVGPATGPSPSPETVTTSVLGPTLSPDPEPTRTRITIPFAGLPAAPEPPPDEGLPSGKLPVPRGGISTTRSDGSSSPVFGAAALALIAAASAVGLERLRRREKERAALRKEMAERNAAAEAREQAQRMAFAAAAAAVAAAKAAERVARRQRVESQLAQNMARLERFGPPAGNQMAVWKEPDPNLLETQVIATSYMLGTGQLSEAPPLIDGTATPNPPSGTSTPELSSAPSPVRAPFPPGFDPLVEPWPPIAGQTLVDSAGYLWKYARVGQKIYTAWPLRFAQLQSGKVGVRVADLVPPGQRLVRRLDLGYPGTRYNVSTLSKLTAGNLMRRAARNAGMVVPLLTTLGSNLYEFGFGSQRDKGIWSNEFAASSMVDFTVAGLTGLAAAGAVAGTIGFVGGVMGVAAVATAPFALALGATALVALGIGLAVDQLVDIGRLKTDVASGLSAWGGIAQNVGTIANVAAQRAGQTAQDAVDRVWGAVTDTASSLGRGIETARSEISRSARQAVRTVEAAGRQVVTAANDAASEVLESASQVIGEVRETVSEVADNVGGFFKGLFGGGDS